MWRYINIREKDAWFLYALHKTKKNRQDDLSVLKIIFALLFEHFKRIQRVLICWIKN